jgi:predicted Holliday junction resolvase-like endonuclease
MSEETIHKSAGQEYCEQYLANHFGIDGLQAEEVVKYVFEAQRAFRQQKFEKWVNREVIVEIDEMRVECLIKDIKVIDGKVLYQIRPLAGKGHKWVDSKTVQQTK